MASPASSAAELAPRLERLRRALPAFGPLPAQPDEDLAAYLRFYAIDLGEEYAQLAHQFGFIRSGDYQLCVHAWRRPGVERTLLLVHGYFDHVGLFGHLVRFGLAQGYNVVAFDLPGHGLSTGEPAVIDDFADYVRAVRDVMAAAALPATAWSVMAQSTGGAAVMTLLQQPAAPVFEHVVLLAPLVRPAGWQGVRLAHALLHRFRDSVPRRFAENSHDAAFLAFLQSDPLQSRVIPVRWVGALRRWLPAFLAARSVQVPLLVVQGDEDGTVDWRYNLGRIRRQFPQAVVFPLPSGRHHLANESEALRSQYLAAVSSYLRGEALPATDGGATL